jgi:hypothetical protein
MRSRARATIRSRTSLGRERRAREGARLGCRGPASGAPLWTQATSPSLPRLRARSYEDYLDNQITATDMFYLEDVELARHLVELG